MSNPRPPKASPEDIPPARRQPADISLEEIEEASARSQPQKKRRSRPFLLIAIAALASAAGVWQRETILPITHRFYSKASAGIAQTSQAVSQKIAGRSSAEPVPTDRTASSSPVEPDSVATPTGEDQPQVLIVGPYSDAADPESTSAAGTSDASNPSVPSGSSNQPAAPESDTLLNHRRYDEAPLTELVQLNPNSQLKLQPAAQASVNAMLNKARIEGVKLGIISAFRTVEDQDYLYFKIKAERGQTAKTRAAVSAPPGYSEHHTGYAVDFIDVGRPDTQLSQSFETTAAFQWLVKNAGYFNFEMSFPADNESGVSYEPWHWRYVGDQKSLETFYKEQAPVKAPVKKPATAPAKASE